MTGNLIEGTEDFDALNGTVGNDTILGYGGDDYLIGQSGADLIEGGAGFDYLVGDAGNDVLNGETEDDYLEGGTGNDILIGGTGWDQLEGGYGDDTLTGGSEGDGFGFSFGFDNSGILSWGQDVITDYNPAEDHISIGVGGDTPSSSLTITDTADGALVSLAGTSSILVSGVAANEVHLNTYFESDFNTEGTTGDDYIIGSSSADAKFGLEGNDQIWGRGGNDTVDGGAGYDELYGEEGDDVLSGGDGDDYLSGLDGNDVIQGDAGIDSIHGDMGNDTLTGGAGADTFNFIIEPDFNSETGQYEDTDWGHDIITDYNPLEDVIHIAIEGGDETMLSVTNTPEGALVSYDGASSILVTGVAANDLVLDTYFW